MIPQISLRNLQRFEHQSRQEVPLITKASINSDEFGNIFERTIFGVATTIENSPKTIYALGFDGIITKTVDGQTAEQETLEQETLDTEDYSVLDVDNVEQGIIVHVIDMNIDRSVFFNINYSLALEHMIDHFHFVEFTNSTANGLRYIFNVIS